MGRSLGTTRSEAGRVSLAVVLSARAGAPQGRPAAAGNRHDRDRNGVLASELPRRGKGASRGHGEALVIESKLLGTNPTSYDRPTGPRLAYRTLKWAQRWPCEEGSAGYLQLDAVEPDRLDVRSAERESVAHLSQGLGPFVPSLMSAIRVCHRPVDGVQTIQEAIVEFEGL